MAVIELEKENKLQDTDILHVFELVAYAIDLKGSVKRKSVINSKELILDAFAELLEMMLTQDINLTREKKLEVIHLLSKLKANKEYMNMLKGKVTEQRQAFSDLNVASEHMFKKSQSAFGID